MRDRQRAAIDDLLYDWLADTGAPGASLVVVDDTETVHEAAFGARDLETNDPTTPETLFGVASVTKSFCALAVLQQVERGNLDFEDSVAEHTDVAFEDAADVTIEQLLTHSSGLPNLATSETLLGRLAGLGESGIPFSDRDDLGQFLVDAGSERDDESTGRFLYSNTGYTLLSHAVEEASGRTFSDYVRSEILDPLGMERSTFDVDAVAEDPNHATPYRGTDEGFEATTFPARELSRAPGGLCSTPRELGRYLRFNLAGGELGGTRIIDEELLSRAHEGHVDPLPRYGEGYGYGWMRKTVAGAQVVEHGGSLLTASAAIGFLPDEDLGIALCCVGQPAIHPMDIFDGVVAITQDERPTDAVDSLAFHDRVEKLTGEYASYRGVVTATIDVENGHLRADINAGALEDSHILVPDDPSLSETTFSVPQPGRSMPVEFVETEAGIDLFFDRYRLHKQ